MAKHRKPIASATLFRRFGLLPGVVEIEHKDGEQVTYFHGEPGFQSLCTRIKKNQTHANFLLVHAEGSMK